MKSKEKIIEEEKLDRSISRLEELIYKANILNVQNTFDFHEFLDEVKNVEDCNSLAI